MRIHLVRHGESQGNVDKRVHEEMADHAIPLSARGQEQAVAVGDFFRKNLPPLGRRGFLWLHCQQRRMWVSPYRRTRETASLIEQAAGPGVITDVREHPLLCEQQFGLFDGVPDEELPIRFPAEHAHYAKCEKFEGRFWARMPLGESRFDVAQRVHQSFGTFQRDAANHGIEDLVVVAHGVTVRAFVMMWCHLPVEWFEREPNPKNCSVRLIENGVDKGYVFTP